MSIIEMNRDDLLNRYPGHSFVETLNGGVYTLEFKDGGGVVIANGTSPDLPHLYRYIRKYLVGDAEVLITIDETQRDALTGVVKGTYIYNTDGAVEVYDGVDWTPS